MQKTQYPVLKSTLWLIEILLYGIIVTMFGFLMSHYGNNVYLNWIVGGATCIVFLSIPTWILFRSGHKTAAWIFVGMMIMVAAACLFMILTTWLHPQPISYPPM